MVSSSQATFGERHNERHYKELRASFGPERLLAVWDITLLFRVKKQRINATGLIIVYLELNHWVKFPNETALVFV